MKYLNFFLAAAGLSAVFYFGGFTDLNEFWNALFFFIGIIIGGRSLGILLRKNV